jgi:hypothetical protein
VPHQGLPDGLYVVKQFRAEKLVFHFAILDVGNRLGLLVGSGAEPVVVHQPPEGLRADFLGQTGQWTLVGNVADESSARVRLIEALQAPAYDLFGNNCEHFVHFVASGVRRSPQLALAALVAAGLVFLAAARSGHAT